MNLFKRFGDSVDIIRVQRPNIDAAYRSGSVFGSNTFWLPALTVRYSFISRSIVKHCLCKFGISLLRVHDNIFIKRHLVWSRTAKARNRSHRRGREARRLFEDRAAAVSRTTLRVNICEPCCICRVGELRRTSTATPVRGHPRMSGNADAQRVGGQNDYRSGRRTGQDSLSILP